MFEMDEAACIDVDPELFFIDEESSDSQELTAQALSICNSCPIRLKCLEEAIKKRNQIGIWGGTTTQERDKLIKSYRKRLLKLGKKTPHNVELNYANKIVEYYVSEFL